MKPYPKMTLPGIILIALGAIIIICNIPLTAWMIVIGLLLILIGFFCLK